MPQTALCSGHFFYYCFPYKRTDYASSTPPLKGVVNEVNPAAVSPTEGFESGAKTAYAYAADNVTPRNDNRILMKHSLGCLSADAKTGNMIPQATQNNQQTWNNLEMYIRTLVTAGNEVYVIMGNYGAGGTEVMEELGPLLTMAHVTVPARVWKVIVVLSNGNNDLSSITPSTRMTVVNISTSTAG